MDTKYLANGRNEFLYAVAEGYAFSLTSDNTAVLCSKTDLQDGIYDENGMADEVVSSIFKNKLNRPVEFMGNITIMELIVNLLRKIKSGGISAFKPLIGMPKLNKAVAEGLDKIFETLTLIEESSQVVYLCMGARERIEKIFPNKIITVSPLKYYSATQFKGSIFARKSPQSLIVVDETLDYIGIVFKIDLEKRNANLPG